MSQSDEISNWKRNLIVGGLGLFYLAVCAYCMISARHWINRPFPGFTVQPNNYVSDFCRSDWPAYRMGLRGMDIILAADGQPVSNSGELYDLAAKLKPGTPVTYDVQSGKQHFQLTVPVRVFTLSDYLYFFPLAMLLGLWGYGAGMIVVFLKPRSAASWYFFVAFGALGLLFVTKAERTLTHHLIYPLYAPSLTAAFLVLFALHFPAPVKRSRPISILVVSALLVVCGLYTRSFYTGKNFTYLYIVSLTFTLASSFVCVYLQVRSYMAATDPVIRQKVKIVIFGFVASFVAFFLIYIFAILPRRMNFLYLFYEEAIVPVCLGYAIVKHGLFDLDVFIRRTITYGLVSAIVIAIFFGLALAISLALQNITGQSSQIAAVIATLLVVMIFRPLQARIDGIVDKRFFRERYEYTATIRKASGILVSLINLSQLLNQLLGTVLDAIKIKRGAIFLKSKDSGAFTPVVASGYAEQEKPGPIESGHPLLGLLESNSRPLQTSDWHGQEDLNQEDDQVLAAMRSAGIVLAVPAIYERRLIAVLGLGQKKSGAWYSQEDQEFLQTLMIQTAVSIENAAKVAELKKMVELETSYRELQKLDSMKDDFLSMVSHDLRTPMTSIKGYATILAEKIGRLDQERQLRYLGVIVKESERLTRLINDLLDLQRFEAGRMVLNLQEVDLAKLVRDSFDSFTGAAMAKKQVLEADLPDPGFAVQADPDRISQVVANLLSNATKFTPESGRITISMDKARLDGREAVMVSVQDSGPGVPKEAQGKLFSKFQQVEKDGAKSSQQGSGLGLALVREIVEHHQGRVGIDSDLGRGARFYFLLPILEKGDASEEKDTHS